MSGKNKEHNWSIRDSVFAYFTITALVAIILIGVSLYLRLSSQLTDTINEENSGIINQVNNSIDSHLRIMMKLSDSLYYEIIKNADLSTDSINSEIMLLYNNNRDYIDNIVLLSNKGELLESVPAARIKPNYDITSEPWFNETLERTDNMHFSNPHVQYIFDNSDNQYKWVITMTRAVEITKGGLTEQAVLLMDLSYSEFEQRLSSAILGNRGYLYMIDNDGNLIWHPQMELIYAGREAENNIEEGAYHDGAHDEVFGVDKRTVVIKTVGYTGWRIVGITPHKNLSLNSVKTKLFFAFVIGFILFAIALVNSYISAKITDPIKELEKSVMDLEDGNLGVEVYTGGSYEIEHLGKSVKKMAVRMQNLMDDIVIEHEAKRKSEFDTLQSQINPHFLYNTLDIIVWMIENDKPDEAVRAVTALARFFRISLSKGKTLITVRDELEHVRNYLTIQNMRFKNKFTYTIEAKEDVKNLSSIKLILQPLVENSIYHGMEFMDGEGLIEIKAWKEADDLYISVGDNGLGMKKNIVANLMSETKHVSSKRGSGIGVKNVNERIKIYFGEQYGIDIQSEPDEGTLIKVHLPAISYNDIDGKE